MTNSLQRYCCFCLLLSPCFAAWADVWTYDVPGGAEYRSPDYAVTVESDGVVHNSFVHYSYGLSEYTRYDRNLNPQDTASYNDRGTARHSTAIFSFDSEVTVRVKVLAGAEHITLPLKSAKVLPNYEQAWQVFVDRGTGHIPAQSWKNKHADELHRASYRADKLKDSLSEGYKNPLIVVAQPPERHVPDKNAAGTLVVQPGDEVTQERLSKHEVVWFAPGIHDLSKRRSPAAGSFRASVTSGCSVFPKAARSSTSTT
jgi:hypothetical protein